jgi:mRNA interferase MazF
LSRTKLRPAIVLADAGRGDRLLCQVTSKPYGDPTTVLLDESSFAAGSLHVVSYARPAKLFTASTDLVSTQVGVLTPQALSRIVDAVVTLLRTGIGSASQP